MAKVKIPWKYCECGCHGHDATIGGVYFSSYLNLHTGEYWLGINQHHAHITGVKYANAEAMNKKIFEVLKERKKELAKEAKELDGL